MSRRERVPYKPVQRRPNLFELTWKLQVSRREMSSRLRQGQHQEEVSQTSLYSTKFIIARGLSCALAAC